MIRVFTFMRLVIIGIVVLMQGGCATNQSVTTDTASDGTDVSTEPLPTPLSEEERACKDLAKDLTDKNYLALRERIDTDYIASRAIDNLSAIKDKPELELKLRSSIRSMLEGMIMFRSDDVRWGALSWEGEGDRLTCTVRTHLNQGGVSYVEFDLRKARGKFLIDDWVDLLQQIRVSDLIDELLSDIYEVSTLSTSFVYRQTRKIPDDQRRYFNYLASLKSMDSNQIVDGFDQLPRRFKNKPLYIMIGVRVATRMNDDSLRYIFLRELEQRFGAGGNYDLALMDLYLEDGNYDKIVQAVAAFKRKIGADPVLELLLAEAERRRGIKEAFYKHCLQAIDDDPNYIDTYWILLDQFVSDRRFADAVQVLNVLKNTFGYEFKRKAFDNDEKYNDFVKSDAYKAWNGKRT